jgi:2-polyprenyl-3-methyl-5-hydroxy-6-metoxy-1,4-benzoquinol methylase
MNLLRGEVSSEVLRKIKKACSNYKFFSAFELVEGFETPGSLRTNPNVILNRHKVPNDLEGKRAIDIGCMEGPLAFEMERRNAIVDAVDIHEILTT